MSIRQLSEQIRQGKLTCTELTEYCLALIARDDQAGRKLNTIAEVNLPA